MRVSDANPVQFWPASKNTFNEEEICGQKKDCYFQKFLCDADLVFQVETSSTLPLVLNIYDEDNLLVDAKLFTVFDNYQQITINPTYDLSPNDIQCGKKYWFSISSGIAYNASPITLEITLSPQSVNATRALIVSPSVLSLTLSLQSVSASKCPPGYYWDGSSCVEIPTDPPCPPFC